jgi:hypothetical protein
MKKVCVATYCEWSSYGSVMQSLGLKNALESIGCQSYVVKDRVAPLTKIKMPVRIGKNPKSIIVNSYNSLIRKKTEKRYENSVKFIKNSVDIIYYNDYETLKKNPPVADYYIAGSDQIFHPDLCRPLFFLEFLNNDKKRLTYAASMGKTAVSKKKEETFKDLVKQMDSVSVREKEMVDVLRKYTDKNISVHIDPTFLVDKEKWREYEREYKLKKPYILVYAIYWDRKLNRELKKLRKKTGYDIVLLGTGFSTVYGNKKIYDADPGQFLWLIDNAEAVVTSSFHGVAFSIIFNKKLSAVINPALPSRISDLLELLGVEKYDIVSANNFNLDSYANINKQIEYQKQRSITYLKEILEINE